MDIVRFRMNFQDFSESLSSNTEELMVESLLIVDIATYSVLQVTTDVDSKDGSQAWSQGWVILRKIKSDCLCWPFYFNQTGTISKNFWEILWNLT